MLERAKNLSDKYYEKAADLRHQIHMHPEPELEEENAARLVCEILDEHGTKHEKNTVRTGILASTEGKKPSTRKAQCMLLGADMDALPVQEETNLSYASRIDGKMHVCGYDGHTAGLLRVVLILNELRDEFSGTTKFMLQPAEEGSGGAKPMIEAGTLESPHVDTVFGYHLWGPLFGNIVQTVSGEIMAGVDVFDLELIGKGGHGAHPHTTIDPMVMASKFVSDVQRIISRRLRSAGAGIITMGKFHAGTTSNVIPQNVTLQGTMHLLSDGNQKFLQSSIENAARAVALEFGDDPKLDYEREYSPLINDKNVVKIARKAFGKVLGEQNIIGVAKPDMGAEDFALLTCERMDAYVFVGISKDLKNPTLHHSSTSCWEDENLKVLMQSDSMMALEFLNS